MLLSAFFKYIGTNKLTNSQTYKLKTNCQNTFVRYWNSEMFR